MKNVRRIIAIAMVAVILAGMSAFSAFAEDSEKVRVTLRIEGINECMYFNENLYLDAGATVADLMLMINDQEDAPDVVIADATWGAYVSSIGGLEEFKFGSMSGWNYRVNGEEPSFGISLYELNNDDSIVYFYGDPFGVGMQHPEIDTTALFTEGVIKFTSSDTTYDEEWTPTIQENPVAGATVTLDNEVYTTDENGRIKPAGGTVASGFHQVQIERYDEETGVPTILRYEPGYNLYIPFKDTPESAWYEEAVLFCVSTGYLIGTNPAQNIFGAMSKMTMAQLITVLARIANADLAESTTPYYASALEWAVKNEIIAESEFEAGAFVTRETFIYMFYLAVGLVGTYDMEAAADISSAVDYADLNEDYIQAISWAVASGIIIGTSEDELTITPGFEINRATACQMLLNYFMNSEY